MAAVLVEIKSRMLLPVQKTDDGEEPEDPRAELVRRLLLYEQIKQGAEVLDAYEWREHEFWRPWVQAEVEVEELMPEVNPDDLLKAWQGILRRAGLNKDHEVIREELSRSEERRVGKECRTGGGAEH